MALTWELMPVGGMIAGAIAEFAGAPAAVAVGGVFVAVMALGDRDLRRRTCGAWNSRLALC